MKTLLTFLTASLLLGAGFAGCDEGESTPRSYTDYATLNPANWELEYAARPSVVRVDSEEQLRRAQRPWSSTADDLPTVDFTKQTLILISGEEHYGISRPTIVEVQRHSARHYSIEVGIEKPEAYLLTVMSKWVVGLLVDKLDADSIVTAEVVYLPVALN